VVSGNLSRRAAEQMYESLFLSSFTAFEVFIDELFLTLLVKPSPNATGAVPRVTVRSFSVARELIMGAGRKYVDWLLTSELWKGQISFFAALDRLQVSP
jgi:hypothetical protein